MRLEIFVGLSDRNGVPFEWDKVYPILAKKISRISFATVFKNLEGIYRNENNELVLENSAMFLMILNDEDAGEKIENLKSVFRWFLKETNQESVLFVKNLIESEIVKLE